MSTNNPKLSVLDLVPIGEGFTIGEAISHSVELAKAVEQAGYHRFWVAEHHNFKDIASAATSVILTHLAAHTQNIRLGSGGIMLPNHAPLVIAEQFGTLEAMYPGRIDLGLGRAPGTDMETARALRRDLKSTGDDFPDLLNELQYFFSKESELRRVKAVPGYNSSIPIWLLGSSTYSAQLAAQKGLPFAFAAHFAPDAMESAFNLYRNNYQPSEAFPEPYAIVCINAIAAETQAEAERLSTTVLQKFLAMGRGVEQLMQKPVDSMDELWNELEAKRTYHQLRESIWGTPKYVKQGIADLVERTGVDEVMISSWIHAPEARIKSYELIAAD
ncbi:MAG: LLM class flavin-dependent oxidoreductase [Pseudomonadota bacterium]|nr:LLM class flavin-dependent oxidoreductase [Pseudomonadota bacterium]